MNRNANLVPALDGERILHSLRKLKCPFMNSITSPEVLFRPGEIRYAAITWLFSLYDPNWLRRQDREAAEISSLAHMACALGLCSSDDVALVQGGVNTRKQTQFWLALLDIVSLQVELGENVDNQIAHQAEFMDIISRDSRNIFREQGFKSVFPTLPAKADTELPDLEDLSARKTAQVNDFRETLKLSQRPISFKVHEMEFDSFGSFESSLQASSRSIQKFNENYSKEMQPWVHLHPIAPPSSLPSTDRMKELIDSCQIVVQLLDNCKKISSGDAVLRQHTGVDFPEQFTQSIDDTSISQLNARLASINMYTSNTKKR